jgi:hypothetical protein
MIDCPRISYGDNLIVARSSLAVRVLSLSLWYRVVTVDSVSREIMLMRRMAGLPVSVRCLPFRDVRAIVYRFGHEPARIEASTRRPGRLFVGIRLVTGKDVALFEFGELFDRGDYESDDDDDVGYAWLSGWWPWPSSQDRLESVALEYVNQLQRLLKVEVVP